MKIQKNYLFFFVFFCFFKILIFLFWSNLIIKSKNINLTNFSLLNSKFAQEQDINFDNELKKIEINEFKALLKIKNSFPQYFQESNKDKINFLLNQVLVLILDEIKNHNYQFNNQELSFDLTKYLSMLDKYDLFNGFKDKIEEIVFDSDKYIFVFPGSSAEFKNYDKYLMYKDSSFKLDNKGTFWSNWFPKNFLFISKNYLDTVLKLSIDIWDSKNNQDKQSFINELELLQKKYILLSKADTDFHFIKYKIKNINVLSNRERDIIDSLEQAILAKEYQYRQQADLSEQERLQLKSEIDRLRNDLITNKGKITQYEKALEKAHQDLETTSVSLETIKAELQQDHQSSETTINTLQTELRNLQEKRDQLQGNLGRVTSDNADLKNQNEQLTRKLTSLQEEIGLLKERLAQQRQIIDRLNQVVSETHDYQSDLLTSIDSLEQAILAKEYQYRQQADLSEQERLQLKSEIDRLRNDLITNKGKITQYEKALEKAHQDLETTSVSLETIKAELQQDHQSSETTINTLQTELRNLQEKRDQLQGNLGRVTSDNADLNQKIDNHFNAFERVLKSMETVTSSLLNFLDKKDSENIKNTSLNTDAQRFFKDTSQMPLFSQLIGMTNEKEQLQDYLNYLKNTNQYLTMGMKKSPKGIILYGPPGTGKTYLAEAFARESGLSVFTLSSSDFSKTYVGEAPRLIENLFMEARKKFPSIILIDECESVFRSRSSNSLTTDHGNIVAAFLSYLEGVHEDKEKPVFIVAMTNILEEIDSAILSRFDKRIKVDLWDLPSIREFLKLKAKDYKLDLMAYDYLINDIPKIIFKFNYDELKTPRGLISLLNQAVTISQRLNHQHPYIKLIDLQLSLDLKLEINQVNHGQVNWENHQHQDNNWKDLAFIKEYNGIPIKQLFADNNFELIELEYYQLIKNNSQENKKPVYISLRNDGGYFYDIHLNNMWPEHLLGFYLDFKDVITDNLSFYNIPTLKISNPEELLRLYITNDKYKVNCIYFVWDLFKQKEIISLLSEKWENFIKEYPFLRKKKNNMIEEINPRINSLNDLVLNELFNDWLKQFKDKWINEIISKINLSQKMIKDLLNLNIVNLIEEEINLCWKDYNISRETCLEKIIIQLNKDLYNRLKNLINDKITEIINRMSLNKKIFSQIQIEQIKEYLKKTTIQEFDQELDSLIRNNILSEEILNKIFVNQEKYFHQQDSLYYRIWEEKIYQHLDLSVPIFEKSKLKKNLINQLIKNYFQQNLELDNIIDNLKKSIEIYQQQFEQKLEKKINQIVNRYFLSNYFHDSTDINTINLISKRASLWINHNLKLDETITSEEEIENMVFNFLQKYSKNIINNQKGWQFWLERNFIKIIIFIILFYFGYFLLRSNNIKK
ncbi:AAA family ATPase ['Planchonia careya' phytoplasma]|nr:AAA family ATPase ['Planchonia careya' phytoplasma]MDO8030040.1 AAA family ATPase ['Planchonia careya' phytoplasma]